MQKRGDGKAPVSQTYYGEKPHRGILSCLALALVFVAGCFITPDPITDEEHWDRMMEDKSSLYQNQAMPTWEISLPEAIARAVKYNLDHRLSMMEGAFHMQQLDSANLAMLPRLALNAGYSIRNNEAASRSISYKYRNESLEPSVSSQVNRINGDLSFSWSLLDFGLSYFQARQQADRYLILQERRRRIMNNLIKDVIIDYFRVSSYEKVRPLVEETLAKARSALETYRKIEVERKAPLLQTLEQERALVTIISHLKTVQTQLAASRARLAALMNMPLNYPYRVVLTEDKDLIPPELVAKVEDLETIGLYLRSDLREEAYQARVDKTEVKKEMLRMIPGLDLFSSGMYDSNRYLVHNWWAEAGARASVDIIGMAAKWKNVKNARTQKEIARYRRLAASVAAMVQINMSYHQYQQSVEAYRDSLQLHHIDNKLLALTQASARAREGSPLDEVRQAAVTLNSRLERDRNLIDVFTAWGNLYFSVGGDIMADTSGNEDLGRIAQSASGSLVRWLNGGLPELPGTCPSLPGGSLSKGYLRMGRIPDVLLPPEDPAAEAAFKAEEERLKKLREERLEREAAQRRGSRPAASGKDAAATRPEPKRPREKAERERRREKPKPKDNPVKKADTRPRAEVLQKEKTAAPSAQ